MNASRDPACRARPVVVYDGDCAFCRREIERMRRRDSGACFEYVARRSAGIERRFPQLADGDFNTGMRLIHTDASMSVGADAVYHIARRLDGWRRLAWLYRVPGLRQLLRIAYAGVARNRHRLAARCDSGACRVDGTTSE